MSEVKVRGLSQDRLHPFIWAAAGFSVVVNILMLVSPLYMLQVYDRVLTSGSIETLVLVSVLAAGLMVTYVFADSARRRVLALAAHYMQAKYSRKIFTASMAKPNAQATLQKDLSDLSVVQSFFSNGLVLPFFDLPFTPFFILVMFLVHPLIGWIGVVGAAILLAMAILTELTTRGGEQDAQTAERSAQNFATGLASQQSAIVSMGMTDAAFNQWSLRKSLSGDLSLGGAKSSGLYGSITRGIRQTLQIGALGAGGWLVLQQQASPGVIVAASILLGRALGPIDQSVSMWRQIVRARKSWADLNARVGSQDAEKTEATPMPRPDTVLDFENFEVSCPEAEKPLLPKFNFTLNAGNVLALVGPSGSGKTALLQTASGAWPSMGGGVSLGGRDLHRWDMVDRGRYVGYLPQNTELLSGTVGQNIARFTRCEPEAFIAIAKRAGVHALIMGLPDGYDTMVGPSGLHLSEGQKQSIGIARAFFGNPVVIFLDEPSASLDQATLTGLKRLIALEKAEGKIILLATHDLRLTEESTQVLMLSPKGIKVIPTPDYFSAIRGAQANLISSAGRGL